MIRHFFKKYRGHLLIVLAAIVLMILLLLLMNKRQERIDNEMKRLIQQRPL